MKKYCAICLLSLSLLLPTTSFAKSKQVEDKKQVNTVIDKKEKNENNNQVIILNKENDKTKEYKLISSRVYESNNITSIVLSYSKTNVNSTINFIRSMIVDEKENKVVTLKDLLGNDYKNIAYKTIKEEIKKSKNNAFLDKGENLEKIDHLKVALDEELYGYYVNNSNVIIVFDKYSIAVGSEGTPEFTLKLNKK